MSEITVAKKMDGYVALGSNGEITEIGSAQNLSEVEQLIRARQQAGRDLTIALKKNGFSALSDDEPTEVIDPDPD